MSSLPSTPTVDVVEHLHGRRVSDPYRWLEDEHSPAVRAWMDLQDAHAHSILDPLPARAPMLARLRDLLFIDVLYAPVHRKGRYFYARRHADREKAIVYWKDGEDGAEQVLFDPNTWAFGMDAALGPWVPSRDGRYCTYSVKENNSDESVTRIRDVAAGVDLADVLPGTRYYAPSWLPDSSGFYYTRIPPLGGAVTVAERPGFAEVCFHALGTDPAGDVVVHPATGDAKTFINGVVSRDGRWLVVAIQRGWNSTDLFVLDRTVNGGAWQTLVSGTDALYDVFVWNDRFYIHTNDGAPRFRVLCADPARLERQQWREVIPESDATLESMWLAGNRLVVDYLRNAASELCVFELDGTPVRTIAIPPHGSCSGLTGNPDDDDAYVSYSSFTQPAVIYRTSMATGATREWARVSPPLDMSDVRTEQVKYRSKDGTLVSMFLLYRSGAPRDGSNRTILYGYGGFNVNMTPSFSSMRAVWLERGGVFAIPNLRGGGEYGDGWHRDGMRLKKQNVFDDFIAAAEYLIAEGWTSPARLAISGGSNGGLLVGAALTQRPELFRAVLCAVPLLDMLRYHLSGSGRTWIPEYGSADDAAEFEALYQYSPYRRAVDAPPRAYPAVLFESADHDDRVDPLHARKMAAVLQARQAAPSPVLLSIERNAGHVGADRMGQVAERIAAHLAFLESQLS
ncbi:MAG: prolyl oligopeptidase family serine peptidase [Vicinamibacterales bacterium]